MTDTSKTSYVYMDYEDRGIQQDIVSYVPRPSGWSSSTGCRAVQLKDSTNCTLPSLATSNVSWQESSQRWCFTLDVKPTSSSVTSLYYKVNAEIPYVLTFDNVTTEVYVYYPCRATFSAGTGGSVDTAYANYASIKFTPSDNLLNFQYTTIEGGTGSDWVRATASSGYAFDGWYIGSTKITSETSTYTSDVAITAKFVNVKTVSASATTGGSISPSGSVVLKSGESQKFTANNDANYGFVKFMLNGSMSYASKNYYTISYSDSYTSIQAVFGYMRSLTVNFSGVSVTYNGTSITSGSSRTVPTGKAVSLVATLSSGYTWDGWYKNGVRVETDLSYSFEMPSSAVTVEARTVQQYTISTAVSPSGSGTAYVGTSSSPSSTSVTVDSGKTVYLKATANTGYKFYRWLDGNTSASRSITASATTTYTAQFKELYTVTASATNGTVTPTSGQITSLEALNFSASSSDSSAYLYDYLMDSYYGRRYMERYGSSFDVSYTTSSNRTLKFVFSPYHILKWTVPSNCTVNNVQSYPYGYKYDETTKTHSTSGGTVIDTDVVTFSVTASDGYKCTGINGVSATKTSESGNTTYWQFTMPSSNVTFTPKIEAEYSISVKYFDGTSWVDATTSEGLLNLYYYTGSSWQLVNSGKPEIYYYTGSDWQKVNQS